MNDPKPPSSEGGEQVETGQQPAQSDFTGLDDVAGEARRQLSIEDPDWRDVAFKANT